VLTAQKHVLLSWQTGSGKTERFFLERSADAKTWQDLGSLAATDARSYQYTDQQPLNGISYYRLRQQDADGSLNYSVIRIVQNGNQPAANSVRLWPNPAGNSATLQFEGAVQAAQAGVTITNVMGQKMQAGYQLQGNHLMLDLSQLPAGLYIVHVHIQGQSQAVKLSVAR
jgi:hypothetical protein